MARTKNITPIEPIENVTEQDSTGLALAKMRYEQGQMADQVRSAKRRSGPWPSPWDTSCRPMPPTRT
jgi:hypothetical protein